MGVPDDSGRVAAAFAAAPAPLALLTVDDREPRLTCQNAAWNEVLGADAEAFVAALSRPESEIGSAVARSLDAGAPSQVALNGRTFCLSGRRTTDAAGHVVLHLQEMPSPASTGSGEPTHVQHLRDLVDNATALMYIKDTSGRYLMVNQEFTRRFGIATDDIIGKTDHELYPSDSADAYARNDSRVLATGESLQTEEPYGDLSGTEDPSRRWVSLKFPLMDHTGAPYALGAISTDITERKRAEDAVNWARYEAERANKRKDEFVSRMSHELRTPLNAILGFAQILRLQPLDPSASEQVEHIAEAGRHLLSLVNDALDLSWIEAGSPGMRVDSVRAAEPIHQALKIIRPMAVTRNVELASDLHGAVDRWIAADSQRLRQVFINLLSNAVKFNRPQGLVRISCRPRAGWIRYRITDTGPGFSAEQSELLFTPFSRLPGSENIEGSGLGLVLSRSLVEQMGGRLGLERSAPGEGSTFYVDVPVVRGGAAPPEDESFGLTAQALPHVGTGSVVLIDDNVANRQLVEAVLGAMGEIRVHSASNGADGVALVAQVHPDLVLLDLNLPDVSGVQVLERLQRDSNGAPKVIVVSADATPARVKQLRALGVAEYITKPIDVHNLASAITKALHP